MNSSPQANAAMRAAVWHGRHDIRVEDVPLPAEPPPGWVQIRVHWCGICGSDLHEYLAGPVFIPVEAPHPLTGLKDQCILGHEFSGEIVRLGNGVTGFAVGQAVAADACQHCGTCYYCRHGLYNICENLAFTGLMNNGAFAEYVNVPANLLYALPAGFPSEAGALIEPLAVGMHAVKKAGSLLGQNVVVVGAGTIGLSTIMCARAAGAAQVIALEMSSARKAKALEVGASQVLDPSRCDALGEIRASPAGLAPTSASNASATSTPPSWPSMPSARPASACLWESSRSPVNSISSSWFPPRSSCSGPSPTTASSPT